MTDRREKAFVGRKCRTRGCLVLYYEDSEPCCPACGKGAQ